MDQAALLAARPAELFAAADVCRELAAALEAHRVAWSRETAGRLTASDWQGAAADLAVPTVQRAAGRLQVAAAELQLLTDVLSEAAEVFQLARAALPGSPPDSPFADSPPNSPTTGAPSDSPFADPAAAARRAERAAAALARADHADRVTADRLTALTAAARDPDRHPVGADAAVLLNRLADPATGCGSLLADALPAPGTPPDRVAAWWRGLPPDLRRRLTDAHPDLVGNLDGLPARDRDRANRIRLDQLLASPAGLPAAVRDGLTAIHRRLADAGGGDVLLLGIGTEGQGRGVLCFGDPDRADDIAVYVPGFGTELAAVGRGDGDRAQRMREAAERVGGGRTAAAVVWLGYDAPPNEGLDPRSADVASDARARTGADAYGRFLTGLQAARAGSPAHLTAVGHSYGSLVVGLAARRPGGPLADDVVLLGSPGTRADRAEQLGVGADHVHVGAADCDPVGHAPAAGDLLLGGLPGALAGHHDLWFGADPADPAFGAHRFHVAPGDPSHAFASHSAYFDENSESLTHIAEIISHPR